METAILVWNTLLTGVVILLLFMIRDAEKAIRTGRDYFNKLIDEARSEHEVRSRAAVDHVEEYIKNYGEELQYQFTKKLLMLSGACFLAPYFIDKLFGSKDGVKKQAK
jgi:hypothetical protein